MDGLFHGKSFENGFIKAHPFMEIPIQNNKSLTLSTSVRQFRISKSHRLHGCFCPSMYLRESYVFFFSDLA